MYFPFYFNSKDTGLAQSFWWRGHGLDDRDSIPGGTKRCSLLHCVLTRCGVRPSFLFSGTGESSEVVFQISQNVLLWNF